MPAFIAASMATVATGMPLGIWTVEYSESTPFERAAGQRHADHREGRVGGDHPGEVRCPSRRRR